MESLMIDSAICTNAEARWRLHIEPFFGSVRVSADTSDLLEHTLPELTVPRLLISADH
jgi:hypothetical protein